MTNINLLPPEIAQKRKAERRRVLMVLSGLAAAGVVVFVFVVLRLQVSAGEREVEQLQSQAVRLTSAKVQLQQFADRKAELQKREKIAEDVIAKEIEWAKLLNEISMIIPSDVWLTNIKGSESDGLTFQGWTRETTTSAESTSTSSSTETTTVQGHKPVAKWLVRLSLIGELTDIWLTTSQRTEYLEQPAIQFETTAAWKTPHIPVSASAQTAPPAASQPQSGNAPGG